MSSKRISLGSTRSAKPPVGPLLERSSPLRASCCRILARKCAGISSCSLTGKLLQDLGQKVRRNLLLLCDVLHHGIFAFLHLRQVNKGANCVLGRSRINHQSPPCKSE